MTNHDSFDIAEFDVELLHQTEASIIVSCAQDPNMAYLVSRFLQAKHFTDPSFRTLWQFIAVKLEDNKASDINLTTLQLEAQRRDLDIDLTKFIDLTVENEEIINSYARKIKEIWLRDHLRNSINNVHSEELGVGDVIERIKTVVNDVESDLTDVVASKSLVELYDELEIFLENDEIPRIYGFGLPEIDADIVDFAPGNTMIIGATPGGGKTSMGIYMAVNNARKGIPVHFYSLEMSQRQITARFLNALTTVSAKKILSKKLDKYEIDTLKTARKTMHKWPIQVTSYADMPLSKLLQAMRDSKIRYGTEIMIVDYVQLINFQGRTKREEASHVAQKLKSVALELDACIVQMSQLSRNNKTEPDMFDLKETSDLEQAASLIVLMYKDKLGITDHLKTERSHPVFFKIEKQRNGDTFRRILDFTPVSMQFTMSSYKVEEYEKQLLDVNTKKKDE